MGNTDCIKCIDIYSLLQKGGKNAKKLSFCRFLLFCICVFATLFVSLPCVLGRIVFHSKNRSSYEQDYILLFPCGRIVVCPCC